VNHWNIRLNTVLDNVAADEVLLDWAETTRTGPLLRTWEASDFGVVLGYGNAIATEVNQDAVASDNIPVIRRCSGGGTVVQGPGCFNYVLVLPITHDRMLASINGTTRWVMDRIQSLCQGLTVDGHLIPDHPHVKPPYQVEVRGASDLTLNGVKFSGNAQRRRKHYVLFHGTILRHLDIHRISTYLAHPSREPEYRQGRAHHEFVTNVGIGFDTLEAAFIRFFEASPLVDGPPMALIKNSVNERYCTSLWNDKF